MDHGLYTAYLGMRARQRALDVTANNIANASTVGFKAERALYRSIEAAELEAKLQFGSTPQPIENNNGNGNNFILDRSLNSAHGYQIGLVVSSTADHTMGMLKQTGRALDIVLDGEGFLTIQTPNGERYTRAGSLTLNAEGQLVTQNGHLVVGENGPITIPPGEVSISENGSISVQGNFVAQLKLVRFDDARASLLKEGNALFVANTPPIPATGLRVVQNALEMANVNTISEMASMIQTSREFDSLQRTATTLMNDLGRKIANEIGRI